VQIIHYQTGSEKKVKNGAGSICNIFLKVALHAPSNDYKKSLKNIERASRSKKFSAQVAQIGRELKRNFTCDIIYTNTPWELSNILRATSTPWELP